MRERKMYKANRNITRAGFVADKGDPLPSNPTTDELYELGYLDKPKAKKKKKTTKTHEE